MGGREEAILEQRRRALCAARPPLARETLSLKMACFGGSSNGGLLLDGDINSNSSSNPNNNLHGLDQQGFVGQEDLNVKGFSIGLAGNAASPTSMEMCTSLIALIRRSMRRFSHELRTCNKIRSLKKESNTSHVNQGYD